jgi:hypothetical protein
MKLYHGGIGIVEHPQILPSVHLGDFGAGFYTTTDINQARRFVVTKCNRENTPRGYVSIFEAPDDLIRNGYGLDIKVFQGADAEWAQFVLVNRKHRNFEHGYDIVVGAVANDQVYASFSLYENDLIDLNELIERLKVRKLTDQILFHSVRALKLLKFCGSEEVVCQPK